MFEYDVFISYSSKDKRIVHSLAKRLKRDGLRVWLDKWVIKPGDSIPLKIQQGLERSHTILMCMSPAYFESEWGRPEYQSILFRDPTNSRRRLIPLLIENCTCPGIIAHLAYVDYRTCSNEAYKKIFDSCIRREEVRKSEDKDTFDRRQRGDEKDKEWEKQYKFALKTDPKDAETHFNYGNLLKNIGRLPEAEEQYKLALKVNPKHVNTRSNYGNLLSDMGRFSEAEEQYKFVLKINTNDASTHSNYGLLLQKINRFSEAEEQYKLALEVDSSNDARIHSNYGFLLQIVGRFSEAGEQYKLALKVNPNNSIIHYNYGILLQNIGCLSEAEEQYQLALKVNPNDANTHYNYGNLLKNIGRLPEAEEQYKLALKVNPNDASTHSNYGNILSDMDHLSEAEEQYKLALKINSNDALTYSNYGLLLQKMSRFSEAEEQYKLALEVGPDDASIHSNYGILLQEMSRFSEAEEQCKRAIDLDPKNLNAHGAYSLLLASTSLEKEETAIEEARIASRLYGEKGDRIREHLVLAWLYEELANKHYDLKSYLKSGECCDISGNEYIEAGKHAGETFKSTSLTKGYTLKGRSKIRKLDLIDSQPPYSIEVFWEIMNDIYTASKCYNEAAKFSPPDNLTCNACSTSMRCLSEILDCMLAVTKQEEVKELKEDIKKWEEDLAICHGIYKESEKGKAFIQSLHKLILCIEKLEQYKLSGRWKAEIAFKECSFELKTATASTIEGPLQKIIERSVEQMDFCKYKVTRYEGTKAKPLKDPIDTLENMDRGSAEPQDLDYELTTQPWYCIPLPETIEYNAQKLLKLAEQIDVLLLTATDIEKCAVMRLLKPLQGKRKVLMGHIDAETYYIGTFGKFKTVVTKCQMGSLGSGSATLATSDAQRLWTPKGVIMVGIAFGKDPSKQKIGDVLIASQIISYEPARIGKNNIEFRGPIPPSNPTLLNRFSNIENWKFYLPDGTLVSHEIGPILSGEKLVDESEFKASLFKRFPQAIGGEMEGAGLFASSIRVGLPWILVKGICDWGNGNKNSKHQPLAAAAAASLVHSVLSHKGALDDLTKGK